MIAAVVGVEAEFDVFACCRLDDDDVVVGKERLSRGACEV